MKPYRPSPSSAHHDTGFYVLQHSVRSNIGKRVHQVAQGNTREKESQYISSRMLKRSSPYSSTVLEAHTGNTQKAKAAELGVKRRRVDPITFRRKVDVDYVGENLGKRYTQHSSYNRLSGYSDLDRAKVDTVFNKRDLAESSEQSDSDDDASSVGSCSVNIMQADKFSNCSFAVPCRTRELDSCDAESSNRSLDEEENCVHGYGENVEGHIWKHASLLSCLQSFEGDPGICLINFVLLFCCFCASLPVVYIISTSIWLREVTDFYLRLLHIRMWFNFCLSLAHY